MPDSNFDLNEIMDIMKEISGPHHRTDYRLFTSDRIRYYCRASTLKSQTWAFLICRDLISSLSLPFGFMDASLYTVYFNGGTSGKNKDKYDKAYETFLKTSNDEMLNKYLTSSEMHIQQSFLDSASVNTYWINQSSCPGDPFDICDESSKLLKKPIEAYVQSHQTDVNTENEKIIQMWRNAITKLLREKIDYQQKGEQLHTILGTSEGTQFYRFERSFTGAVILALFPRIINESSSILSQIEEWIKNDQNIEGSESPQNIPVSSKWGVNEKAESIGYFENNDLRDLILSFSAIIEMLDGKLAETTQALEHARKQNDELLINTLQSERSRLLTEYSNARDALSEAVREYNQYFRLVSM